MDRTFSAIPAARHTYLRGLLDTFANGLAIFFVLHFCWSYYRNCYRKGYTMDLWHFLLLFNVFIIHVMLPFSRSSLNVFAIGAALSRMQAHVTEAYLISALGYAGLLVGGQLWRVNLGFGLRPVAARLLELPARGSLLLLSSRPLLIAHGIVSLSLVTMVLLYYFSIAGFGFNLRSLLLTSPALRSVAQFSAFYSVLIGSYCLARYYQYKDRSMLVIVCLISVGLLFFGERGNLASMAFLTIFALFIKLRRRLKVIYLFLGAIGGFSLAIVLDALRSPSFNPVNALGTAFLSTFYGNSFSDTRDFALVLSYWDGQYFDGLTYVAGIFAFVPRFLSSFRDHWAFGVVTATMAGYSPTEHPGLRVGIFGEAYLNFGLLGVILLSLFVGATVRLVDLRMKQADAVLPKQSMIIFSYIIILSVAGVAENSTTASSLYSILLIFLVSAVMLRVASFLKLTI